MKPVTKIMCYGLTILVVAVYVMTGSLTLQAAEPLLNKKILVLNSYHAGYKGSDDIVLGFNETLRESFPDAEISIEYLDSKHFSGPEFDRRVLDTLTFKYQKRPYDLVVSTDDYAFNVLEQHRNRLFGLAPVVFSGTNNFDKQRLKALPDFIGIDESPSFVETLDLMFKLHPDTQEIIGIHDDSVTGQLNSADFRKAALRFESRAKFSYRSGKQLNELVAEASRLKPGTLIVYFASFVQGAHSKRHSSIEALNLISKASTVPIYGGWEFNLGHGIVGGRLINLREHGRAAALLAVKVLHGASPRSLTALQPSPNQFMFDYSALKRFNISESSLPVGSTFINRPPSFFTLHGTMLLGFLSASLLLLAVLIFAKLLISNRNLKQSQIKFSSMVAAFDGFMYVCSADFRIEFMNEQMIKRTGYDATGSVCYKTLHGLDSVCSWCPNKRVFDGESVQWELQSPKDGLWYHVSDTPVKNADGTVSKQAMITNITDRKQAEEAKLKSEQNFRAIINASPLPLAINDRHGNITYLNKAFEQTIGYTRNDIPTMEDWWPRAYPDEQYRYAVKCEWLQNMEEAESSSIPFKLMEIDVTCKDGAVRTFMCSSAPLEDNVVGSQVVIFYDITERKRSEEEKLLLEQQLQQSQRLESLGVLAGGIAHDFNNILAIIIGYCSLIKFDFTSTESNIPHIEKAAERAAGLCHQMLAYAGKSVLTQTHVNMWMLVDEMLNLLKASINQNVAITSDLSSSIPSIYGDANQLRQVTMNLVINASEAIGDTQGVIRVALTKATITEGQVEKEYHGKTIPPGRYVCLEVNDTGCGMDDETMRRIFEPFYSTKFPGRGLGMSAVLGIISAHNGALQIRSELGKGTSFKVYLPVLNNDLASDEHHQVMPPKQWQGSGTILLVEDEEEVRMILKTMLKSLGFNVIEAAHGVEALELFHKQASAITLVVTDMGMPVMDGYELFRELKGLNPVLPIIISSGFGDSIVNARINREDIAGLISKPYNFGQLQTILKSVMDSGSAPIQI